MNTNLRRPAARRGGGAAMRANVGLLASVVAVAGATSVGVLTLDWSQQRVLRPELTRAEPDQTEKQATFLARSTLLALQHANVTENYAVLWHLSAPDFQRSNPPERLAEIFAETRRRRLDLSIAAIADPEWIEQPKIAADGHLKLKGTFPARGGQLRFDLDFVPHGGLWRLMGVAVAFAPDMRTAEAMSARP